MESWITLCTFSLSVSFLSSLANASDTLLKGWFMEFVFPFSIVCSARLVNTESFSPREKTSWKSMLILSVAETFFHLMTL